MYMSNKRHVFPQRERVGQMRKAESMHGGQMKMKEFLLGSEISSTS